MRTISIILPLLTTIQVFGQETLNQLTSKGQKTGKWVEHHENGTISQICFYEPSFSLRNHEEFVYETWEGESYTVHYVDTASYGENLLWRDKHEYNSQNEFVRAVRFIYGEEPVYLYGPNQEIGITSDEFNIHDRVSKTEIITVEISNRSEELLTLTTKFEGDNLSTKQKSLALPPKESSTFTFQIAVDEGANNYIVTLHNDSISVDIKLSTRGYHIKSSDLSSENQFSVSNEFTYWRSGNEALLRIYDSDQEKLLQTFSLAHEETEIDFTGINPGNYILCKKDFSQNQETCCKLTIEK
ncbi:MAG: hypothetical protein AAGC47_09970 [Bacteroidota bacterium]